jgi:diguanylate cyclase (GGDEF)-like protein/PAS domain S-box-containing protein
MNESIAFHHFEDLLKNSQRDAIYSMQLPSGVYDYFSSSAATLFGYTPEEFYAQPLLIRKIIHPNWLEYFDNEWKRLLNNQAPNIYEYPIRHKDGTTRWLFQRNHLEYNSQGEPLSIKGWITDVTKYKEMECDLQQNRKRFLEISQISTDWVWEVNAEGVYTYVSSRVKDFLGYEPEEIIGQTPFDTMETKEAQKIAQEFTKIASKQESFRDLVNVNIHKDGSEVILQTSGIPIFDQEGDFAGYRGTDRDITRAIRYKRELEIASNVFKYSTDGIVITNAQNQIISINKAFEKMTGYTLEEVKGKNPNILSSGWADKEFYEEMWVRLHEVGCWENELWDRKKDGTLYAIHQSIICVRDCAGEIQNYIGISHDITDSKNKEKKIKQLAYYDFLTKLPNRKLFEQEVESFIKSAHYNQQTFALLFLDLDNFKWVNDSLGHQFGDQVLIDVSQKIKEILDSDSIIARLGGDEFVVLAPYRELLNISHLASKIIQSVQEPILIDDMWISVGWSIGISLFPQNGTNYDTLLKSADIAMYEAKNHGKNRFRYFSEEMNQEAKERLQIDTRLREALNHQHFSLSYQPKVDVASNQIVGLEALIRWDDPVVGNISPEKFIPIAEESGYIYNIGLWVIKQVLCDIKQIHQTHPTITVAINISSKQLESDTFIEDVTQILAQSSVDPKLLEFEITETSIMKNIDQVIPLLNKIKHLGISISVDDFGTGYSSMAYLKKLPIDTIKIDRAFINELQSNRDDRIIVEAIVALSRAMQLRVIAEGVENKAQRDILSTLQCDIFQGYLYSKPLQLDRVLEFLNQ